jgi:hypothetical protein
MLFSFITSSSFPDSGIARFIPPQPLISISMPRGSTGHGDRRPDSFSKLSRPQFFAGGSDSSASSDSPDSNSARAPRLLQKYLLTTSTLVTALVTNQLVTVLTTRGVGRMRGMKIVRTPLSMHATHCKITVGNRRRVYAYLDGSMIHL